MSTTSRQPVASPRGEVDGDMEHWNCQGIWHCPQCQGALRHEPSHPALVCAGCGARFPIEDDILIVRDRTSSNNEVAQKFYDSPLWPKFRFWEWFTWLCNGGERRARDKVLRHLPTTPGLDLLDVAIGDGVYLDWLPVDWRIVGVDISRSQLQACRRRAAGRMVWLAQCEAEELPLESHQFDAILSIGAFNYFNDPEGALREMVRVARPGAPIVISDELPNLTERMLGHKLGIPGLDRWIVSRLMHLGDSFTDMVERHRDLDVRAIAGGVLKDLQFEIVWRGVGYVLVGRAPG
jgi:ubiquinone/menaquinone biosynthesis C-methylase UbiE